MSDIVHPVAVLRRLAEKHRLAAERFEAAADAAASAYDAEFAADESSPGEVATPTTMDVAKYLAGGAKRKPEIAGHFKIREEALDGILTKENGFTRGKQGWWTHRDGPFAGVDLGL